MNLSKTSFYIIKQTDKSTKKKIFFLVIKSVKKIILQHFPNEKKKWFEALTSFNNLPKWKIKRWFRFGENEVTKKFGFFMTNRQKKDFLFGNIICQKNNFATFTKREKEVIWSFNIIQQSVKMKSQKVISVWENKVTKNLDFWWMSQKRHFTSLNKLTNRQKDFFFWL